MTTPTDSHNDSDKLTAPPLPIHQPIRRRFPIIRTALVVLLFAILATGGYVWWAWSSEPTHWSENRTFIEQSEGEDLDQLASQFWSKITRMNGYQGGANAASAPTARAAAPTDAADATSTRAPAGDAPPRSADATDPREARLFTDDGLADDAVRSETFTEREINAWLTRMMPDWLANQNIQMPRQIHDPMVALRGDRLIFAFDYAADRINQVVSLHTRLELRPNGKAQLHIDSVTGGRLPLPASELIEKVKAQSRTRGGGDWFGDLYQVLDGQTFDPVWPHPGHEGMQLRLTNLEFGNGKVTLTATPEPMR